SYRKKIVGSAGSRHTSKNLQPGSSLREVTAFCFMADSNCSTNFGLIWNWTIKASSIATLIRLTVVWKGHRHGSCLPAFMVRKLAGFRCQLSLFGKLCKLCHFGFNLGGHFH